MAKVIGYGTWYDKAATSLVERERHLGRSLGRIRSESGLGASGFPHIGSLADGLRSCAVALAVRAQGYSGESIAFSDDLDGLRKVPAGLPRSLEKWLGTPVTSIPDPFKCHESYGQHMSSLLLESMDRCGAEYTFMSGRDLYRRGVLKNEIREILGRSREAGKIIEEEVGQEKFMESLPYFPICSNCGRIYTTRAYEYVPDEGKVLYRCEGMEVRGRILDGCGHQGEAKISSDEGKLNWKVEFAARWKALDIRFEAHGKDIADSVRVNDRICKEILGFEPPMHVRYEMFLDKSGRKISKSAGNVFTPQVWFRYGSPQSLNLLILKRFVGTRTSSVMDIPGYMDEFDDLEESYFSEKGTERVDLEGAKLRGLYSYCWMLRTPSEPSIHVPYNLLVYLSRVAPKDNKTDFIQGMLRKYGLLKEGNALGLQDRIAYAENWATDFEEIGQKKVLLEESMLDAVSDIIETLESDVNEDGIQTAIYAIARKRGIAPRVLFQTLYRILIGADRGPRLGPYIVSMGKDNVIDALRRAQTSRR